MKKLAILVVFIISICLCGTSPVYALEASDFDLFEEESIDASVDFSEITNEQLNSLNLAYFDEFLSEEELEIMFSGSFSQSVAKLMKGEFFSDGQTVLSGVASVFFSQLKSVLPIFVTILAVTILVSVLSHFASDFLKEDMQNLISFALVLIVIAISAPTVLAVSSDVQSGIDAIALQAESAFPILITLVYALGGTASATCFSPLLYTLSNVILKLVSQYILPVFMFILGVNMINALSKTMNFSSVADFFLSIAKYALGITFTVFSASMALQGISAGSFDSISYRTAKYAISNTVPVIGSYVRDGFDLILFSGVLIKNAVGVGFVLMALAKLLAPVTKLTCVILLFKLTEGLCGTFAPKEVSGLYKNIAKSLSLILSAYIAVFFMYSIAIVMLMISTNIMI